MTDVGAKKFPYDPQVDANGVPVVNLPLLDHVMDLIRTSGKWDQGEWFFSDCDAFIQGLPVAPECGTAFCAAGFAAASIDGARMASRVEVLIAGRGYEDSISDVAGKALGLTIQESAEFFRASNDLPRMERIYREIVARAVGGDVV